MPNDVSIIKTESYDDAVMRSAVDRHFELLNLREFITPSAKIVLKPNLLMRRRPDEHTTTHPSLVSAVLDKLIELGAKNIILADSPGGPYTKAALSNIYAGCGMTEACEDKAELNFDTGYTEIKVNGRKLQSVNVINPLARADVIINLCKFKTHAMMNMTCAVKNMLGAVPGLQKPEMHFRFSDGEDFAGMLVDLSSAVSLAFSIVDAVVGMEGNGPSGGTPREIGLTLGSRCVYSLDLAAAYLMGYRAEEVETVSEAIRRNLCPECVRDLTLLGDTDALQPITDYKHPPGSGPGFVKLFPSFVRDSEFLAKTINKIASGMFLAKPVIIRDKCIGCGKCAESCPAKTINITKGKAVINYRKCINCYCCHEMCPVKVIELKRGGLSKW